MKYANLTRLVDLLKDTNYLKIIGYTFGSEAENIASQYADRKAQAMDEAERHWRKYERPKVRKEIEQFIKDNPDMVKEAKENRLKEYEEKMKELEEKMKTIGDVEKKEEMYKEVEKLNMIINSDITPYMIERARDYPIENIIQSDKDWAVCPFHDDKNPSFYIKNNYGYCFSCGEQADSIKLYKKINNCSFKEAVLKLN